MRLLVRWGVAIVLSAAVFAVAWWACQERARLDEGSALGVAGALMAVVLAVAGWWAAREPPGVLGGDISPQVVQKARGGRDVNIAGRDQTIINYWYEDE